jgi:RHS repeat-associated protein
MKLTTVLRYGDFGTVESTTVTDNAGQTRRSTLEYDGDHLHPIASENALLHRTTMITHSGLGVPLSTTDPNGVVSTMRYDWFGRPREVNNADGSWQRVTHRVSDGWQYTDTTTAHGRSSSLAVDQLGRERQNQSVAFDGTAVTRYTNYDQLGRVAQVSLPAAQGAAIHYTTSAYDNRDRLTSVTAPDGAMVRHTYVNRETHTYDARNVHSYLVKTVDGQVESSYEINPESGQWMRTRFEYEPFGETKRIEAPDGTAQVMQHDLLGRPERLDDPSSGTTSTIYSAFDEVLTETDGTGAVTEYRHDLLGRVDRTVTPQGVATTTWDTAPTGIGKVANAKSADGTGISYRYDSLSRPSTTTWNIDAVQYEMRQAYDGIGRPASVEYPSIPGATGRLKVTNVYNQFGYLSQVKDAAAGGPVYWTAVSMDPAGQLTGERFGNGVTTNRTYQPQTGLLERITTTGPGTVGTLVDLTYRYDPNRNVIGRDDTLNGRPESYVYDELDRLKHWLVKPAGQPALAEATYRYDSAGNMRSETFASPTHPAQTITYGYEDTGPHPHQLVSRGSDTYTYDGAGRQITGPQRTVTYNQAGLPTTLAWGQGQNTEFRYDANGARVFKRDTDQTVVYIPGYLERRTPAGTGGTEIHNLHNIVVDGQVVAQVNRIQAAAGGPVTGTEVTYLHPDAQHSTVRVTNAAGRPVGEEGSFLHQLFYDPFGRRIDAQFEPLGNQRHGGPRQGYTQHEHEDEFGLINMRGRIYDPQARRFLTPDPLLADPQLSQSHNRYTYVRNNPATLTDPSGLIASDTRGVYTLFGAGPTRFATGFLNLSRLGYLTLVPESAPLVTHVTQVTEQHVIIAGSSDDDAAQAAQKVKEARMITRILKLAYGGIIDPYQLLELDREASKARAERQRGGIFWAWAAGDYQALDEYFDEQKRELAKTVPLDRKERAAYFREILKDRVDNQRFKIAEMVAIAEALEAQLSLLMETDARTPAERAAGEPPHLPYAAIHDVEDLLDHYTEQIDLELRMLDDMERELPQQLMQRGDPLSLSEFVEGVEGFAEFLDSLGAD